MWLKEIADKRRIRELRATVEERYLREVAKLQSIAPTYPISLPQKVITEVEQHSLSTYEKAVGCL